MPPLNLLDPHPCRPQQLDSAMDAMDARTERRSWAEEMEARDLTLPSSSSEDDLMDAWMEATRQKNADGSLAM
ncbi:hypothetical protein CROQUDRAFT_92396 [Cronartium quercuum f. sp. fusiforme G11]|uniref:Uncharacterized protein n=1 Tax=Cronartium quercuum f. sp. fusiforme G11 TaxID=708437 RepID=A0A9P6NJG3_9BASI|nr:hypothetical protein CROQUDRAFT_92396 [Cronartium quercuum f. sp. fusiforme G11]